MPSRQASGGLHEQSRLSPADRTDQPRGTTETTVTSRKGPPETGDYIEKLKTRFPRIFPFLFFVVIRFHITNTEFLVGATTAAATTANEWLESATLSP